MANLTNIETLRAIVEAAGSATERPRGGEAETLDRLAHDFNNVLAIILGYSDVLQAQVAVTSSQYQTLRKISQAVQRGRGLTSQLVELSRNARSTNE